MNEPSTDDGSQTSQLRALARARLQDAATTGGNTVLGPAAMAALLRLALSPEFAVDALLLQQELYLHQIEIDLLAESLRSSDTPPRPLSAD